MMFFEGKNYDLLVVGCGFAGSVIARLQAEMGKKVLVLEKRNHIAGNMYDGVDGNGILIHHYGPHTLHTNDEEVYKFVSKFGEWDNYILQCGAKLIKKISPIPFNFATIDLLYEKDKAFILKERLLKKYPNRELVTIVELLESNDCLIKDHAQKLFDLDYGPYTSKQWGVPLKKIDSSILKRVPVRLSYKNAYFDDKYQLMPKYGYTIFFKKLLNHPNIGIKLNTDALSFLKIDVLNNKIFFKNKEINIPIVYTGPIDALFNFEYKKLPYRSLHFKHKIIKKDSFQPYPVVAYPKAKKYTRIVEYKKLPMQNIDGITHIVYEYPLFSDKKNEPYYPILTSENIQIYEKYKKMAEKIKSLYLCGRLAEYKYYNMDIIIKRAFEVSSQIKKNG